MKGEWTGRETDGYELIKNLRHCSFSFRDWPRSTSYKKDPIKIYSFYSV